MIFSPARRVSVVLSSFSSRFPSARRAARPNRRPLPCIHNRVRRDNGIPTRLRLPRAPDRSSKLLLSGRLRRVCSSPHNLTSLNRTASTVVLSRDRCRLWHKATKPHPPIWPPCNLNTRISTGRYHLQGPCIATRRTIPSRRCHTHLTSRLLVNVRQSPADIAGDGRSGVPGLTSPRTVAVPIVSASLKNASSHL